MTGAYLVGGEHGSNVAACDEKLGRDEYEPASASDRETRRAAPVYSFRRSRKLSSEEVVRGGLKAMASYIDLDGVRTWYDEHGAGAPLVLLHPGGGGVDSRAFAPNPDALAALFHTFTPERRGHGRTPDVDGPLTFEDMARDAIRFLEQVVGRPAPFVGCSDGAIVALLVAPRRPELVTRLVFVAGVFHP